MTAYGEQVELEGNVLTFSFLISDFLLKRGLQNISNCKGLLVCGTNKAYYIF